MVRRGWIALWIICLLPSMAAAQEVLLPLQRTETSAHRLSRKSSVGEVRLPLFDDFAAGTMSADVWQPEGGATVAVDVSPLAPTVGVATLDAMDGEGRLYESASTERFVADTLTSLPIRIDGMTPADSVVLSFYYLPGGGYGNMWERMGDTPDEGDSLLVDFFRPADSSWVTVWATCGVSVDTLMARTGEAWQYVALPLTEADWFDSTFRFRFRNYASLPQSSTAGRAGNCDFWHLDYVVMDRGRDAAALPQWRDVAFAAPAPSMLQHYRNMPFNHYNASATASAMEMWIANLYSSDLASHYEFAVFDTMGNELFRYDGGFENAPAHAYQSSQMHARPTVGYAFPAMTEPTDYVVVHTVREGTGGDGHGQNDTVRYRQSFGRYYAYDDGTPENGFGLSSTSAQLYLAYRFDVARRDTLTAVDCYFNHTLDDQNASVAFYLTVWSMDAEGRPAEVLYRDAVRRFPAFGGFAHYVLEAPVVVEGSVFVGLEQSGSNYLNLGYDRSMNTADRIYYLTGTEWQQSILSGSLMIRPCFGAAAAVGIDARETVEVKVYPNPADERVTVAGFGPSLLTIYDLMGREVVAARGESIDTQGLPDGFYMLKVSAHDAVRVVKLLIKHQ